MFNKENKQKAVGAAQIGGGVYLTQAGIRSGIPRLVGVRLESHSTSKANARNIRRNNYLLDPKKGGSGAAKSLNNKQYINNSSNYVHITGRHSKAPALPDNEYTRNLPKNKITQTIANNPITDLITKKSQRGVYRSLAGTNYKKDSFLKKVKNSLTGHLGLRGKTFYVGGTDKFFNKNFISDVNDVALKTNKPLRVYGNRFSATRAAIKQHGLWNLIKSNPSRVAGGAALTTIGVGGGTYLNYKGIKNLFGKNKNKRNART